jgi:hypothetical protein
MLSVAIQSLVLLVIMLNVVILNIVAPGYSLPVRIIYGYAPSLMVIQALSGTKTLAYFVIVSVTKKKSFITLTTG